MNPARTLGLLAFTVFAVLLPANRAAAQIQQPKLIKYEGTVKSLEQVGSSKNMKLEFETEDEELVSTITPRTPVRVSVPTNKALIKKGAIVGLVVDQQDLASLEVYIVRIYLATAPPLTPNTEWEPIEEDYADDGVCRVEKADEEGLWVFVNGKLTHLTYTKENLFIELVTADKELVKPEALVYLQGTRLGKKNVINAASVYFRCERKECFIDGDEYLAQVAERKNPKSKSAKSKAASSKADKEGDDKPAAKDSEKPTAP